MLSPSSVKINDQVLMGRPNGQKVLCKIVRINQRTCSVENLEQFGTGRSSAPGSQWRVPWSMLYPRDGRVAEAAPVAEKLEYSPFTPADEVLMIQAIGAIYCQLSPENLSCDGERPHYHVIRIRTMLQKKLRLLQQALGREVSEDDYYNWDRQRKATAAVNLNLLETGK